MTDVQLLAVAIDSDLMRRVESAGLDEAGVPCKKIHEVEQLCSAYWAKWQPPTYALQLGSEPSQLEWSEREDVTEPMNFRLDLQQAGFGLSSMFNELIDADEQVANAMVWGERQMGENVGFTSPDSAARFGALLNAVDWDQASLPDDASDGSYARAVPTALAQFYQDAASAGLGVLATKI